MSAIRITLSVVGDAAIWGLSADLERVPSMDLFSVRARYEKSDLVSNFFPSPARAI